MAAIVTQGVNAGSDTELTPTVFMLHFALTRVRRLQKDQYSKSMQLIL